ncbi:MAG: DEAD/DEAH box helicase [Flavobacteriaceae bacterium]|nr:DEAD/DEAH box helicase [Flavobacteriaceae bacterium]
MIKTHENNYFNKKNQNYPIIYGRTKKYFDICIQLIDQEMSQREDDLLVYHGTWIPGDENQFDNLGQFMFWVETPPFGVIDKQTIKHPHHLIKKEEILNSLSDDKHLSTLLLKYFKPRSKSFFAHFPINGNAVLPSTEMGQLTGEVFPDKFQWKQLKIHSLSFSNPLDFLRELNIISSHHRLEYRLGADLKFWIEYSIHLERLVQQHQYIPVLKPHNKTQNENSLYLCMGWNLTSEPYDIGLREYASIIPGICLSARLTKNNKSDNQPRLYWNSRNLLAHFSEQQLEALISKINFPHGLLSKLDHTLISDALDFSQDRLLKSVQINKSEITEKWNQWHSWKSLIDGHFGGSADEGFQLGIRIEEPVTKGGKWKMLFFVSSKNDPSLQLDLGDWWRLNKEKRSKIQKQFGDQFERTLLVKLGNTARMSPILWEGMQTSKPIGFEVDLETAYNFLKNDSIAIESTGVKIVLPSWWLPEGRKRLRIKIKASNRKTKSSSISGESQGFFDGNSLINYDYSLAIGNESISKEDWDTLVQTKQPLVQFRGHWMELESEQLKQVLSLWEKSQDNEVDFSLDKLVNSYITADEELFEYDFDKDLSRLLKGLRKQDELIEFDSPKRLMGELRPYQKKGLYWLNMHQNLSLNPCLADDMGLGKTIQIIALLLHEKEQLIVQNTNESPTTLLVAPTSVLTNWQKEINRFAPSIKCILHHGSNRESNRNGFSKLYKSNDVIITSFSIVRIDNKLLKEYNWHRIVVDEAQNIKNPKSAQTKAVCLIKAKHRIAMTGTPIENRLMDLWSLFNYLNPGYLGNTAQFKKIYETPIQRKKDTQKASRLQNLVHPFILRRLKTDKNIIKDLPEKVEQKVYCHLTSEQASLYQTVVDDVKQEITSSEGIKRKGIIVSALTKLKQICNHPKQFLQDGSAFSESRSLKLKRLNAMIEVALDKSESLLVFTQFSYLGIDLEKLLRQTHRCPVFYLRGSTSRINRQKMIDSFQNPHSPASIFLLSLKAGGVGINLTRANHVFHFDRWWNPAVENQATDRAYRIGQEKTVFAYKMITTGTVEEKIDDMLEKKQKLADSIVGTSENWITEMDDEEFNHLITLDEQSVLETNTV